MNGYIAIYRGKRLEIHAETTLQAQTIAAEQFRAKHSYDVSVHLVEIGGARIIQVVSVITN